MNLLEPMKAPNEIEPFNSPNIKWPMWESQKFDGFRLVNLCGQKLISPALKEFPNLNLMSHLADVNEYAKATGTVLDTEIWSPEHSFSELSSILRSHHAAIPKCVKLHVFDALTEAEWDGVRTPPQFESRMWRYINELNSRQFEHVETVFHTKVESPEQAEAIFDYRINIGQEGLILRRGYFGYKHGRCTAKEGGMFKFKQFETHDAVITGYVLQRELREDIERSRNILGRLEREHGQAAYEDTEAIGAFEVMWNGVKFRVKPGKGFTQLDRQNWYITRDLLVGRHIEFKYMPHGTKDKPRIGSMVRFREDKD